NGGDYHPDHIAVHQAVAGQKLPILALNAAHTGQLAITPTISQRLAKLTALSHHRSQFPEPSRIGPPWQQFLAAETYDHILNAL
ncbi:MAG TPA: hypothetical protein VLF67_05510, partial [Candidatus Saccharimonas sp.]|nr:hypothetical protein [Candidatus Saccharimonas sp.]